MKPAMIIFLHALILSVIFLIQVQGLGHSEVETDDDGTSGTIKFSTPDLTSDEAHSPWVPDDLKCDACRAVAYQVSTH